jgi:hypothetical protein
VVDSVNTLMNDLIKGRGLSPLQQTVLSFSFPVAFN